MTKKIKKLLIANRGEIAVRVMNAAREMDITTVAIYSDADTKALHVLRADEAVHLGAAEPAESYLNIEKVIAAAKETGCDAVHPGYGFLSENAAFARACRAAGLIFVGPSAEAMEKVGDKLIARTTMLNAGIPLTPGVEIDEMPLAEIEAAAEEMGYPVMVKAAAGGGGKGMRLVNDTASLGPAIEAGRREAMSAFGSDTVYMEKFIEKPRHIEVQILADQHGNTIHLFERECSIQRRHQKIIEETPSVALDDDLRRKIGETACEVMRAVNYYNAGTVEFLLDANKDFYFLEVNARIQVEHPITEMVTGVDLIKHQIRIATGEKLTLSQDEIRQHGHAIECRIYAEDAANNFLPSIGMLHHISEPAGPGIRCDSGVYSGVEVTLHYDPILSKLIVWAENRDEAIRKMDQALAEYVVLGVRTSLEFLRVVLNHDNFQSGDFDTGFIGQHLPDWQPKDEPELLNVALIAAAANRPKMQHASGDAGEAELPTPWQLIGDWKMLDG